MANLRKGKKELGDSEDDDDDDVGSVYEEDEEGEDVLGGTGGDLDMFEGSKEECKLVLVVRTDLGMGKGEHTHPPLPFLSFLIIFFFSKPETPHPSLSFKIRSPLAVSFLTNLISSNPIHLTPNPR